MDTVRLVIVDDDSETGEFMSMKLSKESPRFDITVCLSAEDCLAHLETHTADCVISDIQMPGEDGVELLRRVRGRGLDVPFIFVTGQGGEATAREAFKEGASDYFTKEVGLAHFTRIVNSVEQAVRARDAERLRKEAEFALMEAESLLRSMAESIDDAFFMVTPDNSEVLYLSPAFERIWGVPAETIYNNPLGWLDSVHEDDRDKICGQVAMGPDLGEPYDIEYRVVRPDGELRWVRNRAYPVFGPDGELDKVCGTVEDITRIKDLQRQKSDMYSMLRHDIKSPLSIIRGNAEVLMKGLDGTDRDRAETIIANVERISGQLDGLVDISRLDEGRLHLNEAEFDPETLIIETLLDNRDRAEELGIRLKKDVEDGLPLVPLDRQYALRALGNLVQNALNHSGHGSEVSISARTLAEGGAGYVAFTVADNGGGIEPGEQEKIFQKYYRSGNSKGVPGSGLGLAVVKAVADAHGGFVRLESAPGKGSSFSICFPAGPG